MPGFGLTVIPPFPGPEQDFPTGIQFQDEGIDVGQPNPTNVNFTGLGVTATYDPSTDTVDVDITASGSGGGAVPLTTFSAVLANDQQSGSTVKFDNVTTDGAQDYAGYAPLTGVLTIQSGDGGMWMFGVEAQLSASIELPSPTTRSLDIRVNGATWATTPDGAFDSGSIAQCAATTGPVRVADGTTVSIVASLAFAAATVQADGVPNTRFWAVRLSD